MNALQEGPLGWEVRAQCSEASLVLWYPEEEERDPDQARTPMQALEVVSMGLCIQMRFPPTFPPILVSSSVIFLIQ